MTEAGASDVTVINTVAGSDAPAGAALSLRRDSPFGDKVKPHAVERPARVGIATHAE